MGLTEALDKPLRTLSGGNQRRAEIARALLHEPDVLLLDEPSTGLDATARRALVDGVAELARRYGLSVHWATHLIDGIAGADRIALLQDGRIRLQGSPADFLAQSGATDLTEAYIALTTPK